jgi:hypothetical protein
MNSPLTYSPKEMGNVKLCVLKRVLVNKFSAQSACDWGCNFRNIWTCIGDLDL